MPRSRPPRLTTVAVLCVLGVLVMTMPGQAAQPGSALSSLTTGTVVASPAPTADTVWVLVAGGSTPVPMSYAAGYTPLPGDQVNILSVGSGATRSGIVVSAVAGRAGNRVPNGDFAVVNPAAGLGVPPPMWYHFRASGVATSTVTGSLQTGHEGPVMVMATGTTAAANDNYAYSSAIPVQPGETYRLDAVGAILAVNPDVTIELKALWFASADALYPATVAADSLADSTISAAPTEFGIGLNTITVPGGAQYMRVAIRIIGTAGGTGYIVHLFSVQAYRNP